jgi:predicted lipid-binding transport protein (Tim44 family)
MFRPRIVLAAGLAVALALAPGLAFARAGGGSSMGSRGGFTFSAPPSTSTAPMGGMAMQRSMTAPAPSPSYGGSSSYAPAFGGGRSSFGGSFASGLMGGLIGAGIGGMLFGHGMFGGMGGGASFLGLLIQLALVFFIGRWLYRTFLRRQPMFAGFGSVPQGGPVGGGSGMPIGGGRAAPPPLAIAPADYTAFEQLLTGIQAAWSAQDMNGLRQMTTPEMLSYFNEQLSELASRGAHNTVTDVRLQKGDLAQAWAEGSREYATVAMQFSMIDVTRDGSGRVVDGSPSERQTVTELWTFVRSRGGSWILSAIQQAR